MMLKLELKRILKTRSTWRLFVVALVLCLFYAAWAVRLSVYYDYDAAGGHQTTRGAAAYERNKEKFSIIEGEVTPERIQEAVSVYQDLMARYGDDYSVPPEISSEVLGPYSPVYTWINRAFTDESGARLMPGDVTLEQALDFYQQRVITLERMIEKKYAETPQVISYAERRLNADGENFDYAYGIGSTNTFDHLGMCTFLVTLICCMLTAPIFSSDYSTGADDILRCTRRGRGRLAVTKLASAVIISLGVFVLCIGAFLAVVYIAFGFDDLTSAELLGILWNPLGLTAAGVLKAILLSSFIAFLAMSSFTLFLSSRFKSPAAVLALSIAVALIPTVMALSGAEGNLLGWIRLCLPSGGVLPAGALVSELGSLRFLWIGGFVTWSPYVMLTAGAAQIPLWLALAIRAYDRHQAA